MAWKGGKDDGCGDGKVARKEKAVSHHTIDKNK
jgi:hypothetical protein